MAGIIEGLISKTLEIFGQQSASSIVLFALILLIAYYAFQVMQDIMIIIIISVAFPFMSNSVLGTTFATNIWSLIWFSLIGVGLYFVYLAGTWFMKGSSIVLFLVKIITAPFVLLISLLKRLIFGSGKKKEKK